MNRLSTLDHFTELSVSPALKPDKVSSMTDIAFNFIIDSSDKEISGYKRLDLNLPPPKGIFSRGDLSWCLQTYLNLKKRNLLNVQLSNQLEENCINIIHSDHLLHLKGNKSNFVVCVRADYPKRRWAHYHIVQNKNQLSFHTSYIPHWPQPGLIKRNPERKEIIRVAYAGQTYNGNLAGSTEYWKNALESNGFEFVTTSDGNWHDLSAIDALVGIRSFDKNPHNTKPPTKLFNAWHAEIPFIGGYDSAFQQVGTPGEDYLLVASMNEVIEALVLLRDDNELRTKLITNGAKKAVHYTKETIATIWEEELSGPIFQRYEQWASKEFFESTRFNFLRNVGVLEHQSKQLVKRLMYANNK